jgi:WD40 repeat protein
MMFTIEGHSRNVTSVAISPDGQTLASGSEDETTRLWNLNGTLRCTYTCQGGSVNSVAISPDGKTLASSSFGRIIRC